MPSRSARELAVREKYDVYQMQGGFVDLGSAVGHANSTLLALVNAETAVHGGQWEVSKTGARSYGYSLVTQYLAYAGAKSISPFGNE